MDLDEEKLKQIAKPYIDKCRPGDWNHALRVVKWVKILGDARKDIRFLITAAYLHDIGWSGVMVVNKVNFDEMLKLEKVANNNTPRFTREVLQKLNFKGSDIKIVIRLIRAADRHESKTEDEAIIVDADNLSKLCVDHLREKYEPESYRKLIDNWENQLSQRIRTKIGKESYPSLLLDLKKQLNIQ